MIQRPGRCDLVVAGTSLGQGFRAECEPLISLPAVSPAPIHRPKPDCRGTGTQSARSHFPGSSGSRAILMATRLRRQHLRLPRLGLVLSLYAIACPLASRTAYPPCARGRRGHGGTVPVQPEGDVRLVAASQLLSGKSRKRSPSSPGGQISPASFQTLIRVELGPNGPHHQKSLIRSDPVCIDIRGGPSDGTTTE